MSSYRLLDNARRRRRDGLEHAVFVLDAKSFIDHGSLEDASFVCECALRRWGKPLAWTLIDGDVVADIAG